ncbi:flagellar hook-basal body complex protein [Lederbergia wuyishanensis]|uniref:Flagellar hook protein FlgE n=1 Tax=Lederbergia wuyishanensis TaxID=1347903 RepID=A0ABU0CZP9_9BACI|nr:flagellar hook-basal body complex protein [Lederbergia wuyishanensis]MCJ8006270.1 flagellar hook-basal body complex protein [Lederbergia wuyishanensis]MDQ0341639.1 flagellar hook protein FlgE [Lederbergia wuyishanensis]
MIRSMYSGISGMKNFQTKLDVIGNNIANVNTYGFKKGRVTFKDMVSQTISGASAPTQGRGGTNPKQVGLGSQLASIDMIDTQGSLQTTGRVLDLAIQGDGYLTIAEGTPSGDTFFATSTYYTRAGNLYLNNDGYVVTGTGHYVLATNPSDNSLQPIRINGGKIQEIESFSISENGKISFIKTSNQTSIDKARELIGNIAGTAKNLVENPTSKKYLDSLVKITDELDEVLKEAEKEAQLLKVEADNLLAKANAGTDARAKTAATDAQNRAVDALTKVQDIKAKYDDLKNKVTDVDNKFTTYQTTPNDTNKKAVEDAATLALTSANDASATISVASDGVSNAMDAIDYIHATELGLSKDGDLYTTNFSITLARFSNSGGLQKVGENMFTQTAASGIATYTVPGSDGSGTLVSGSLEMSNVDLSEEFTEMIVAQRGFQANTRIITTSDEILQELVNLKR